MSISKFRYNKRRKHYSYSFKKNNLRVKNILLTSKPVRKEHLDTKENIKLYKHPNKNSVVEVYIYNHSPYNDQESSFDKKRLNWAWDINDKRKVKRMKKYKKYYGNKKSR